MHGKEDGTGKESRGLVVSEKSSRLNRHYALEWRLGWDVPEVSADFMLAGATAEKDLNVGDRRHLQVMGSDRF